METQARRRLLKVALLLFPVLLLVSIGLPFVMFHLVSPPPGPPLAVMEIRSGQPFELPFLSNGQAPRVFLDMQCESCSLPITGTLKLSVGKRTFHQAEISAGDSRDRAWGGHDRKLDQHLLYDGPASSAGTRVVLSGSLVVGVARGSLLSSPIKGAPPTKVRVLRVTVAP
jgi:hypothetical protein